MAVMKFDGELDLSTQHHVRWNIQQAIDQGCTLIAVDLSGVPFIDCSTLGALIDARQRVADAGGHLVLSRRSPQVTRLMQLTGTDALFDMCDGGAAVSPLQSA